MAPNLAAYVELQLIEMQRFGPGRRPGFAARVGANLERFGDPLDATLIDAVHKGHHHIAVDLHEATFAKTRCFTELQAPFRTLRRAGVAHGIGLPIGPQLAGRWYDDDYLLAIARLVEQALH